jgi:glucosyl-dolichyl phosphate glucuronosyltransferase
MPETLSIIICTLDRVCLLEKCLLSLLHQTLSPDEFEIIIIDNGSKDNTPSFCTEFTQKNTIFTIRYFLEIEKGHSQARNRGWKEAKGKYIAYVDDDAQASKNWARTIIENFQYIKPMPLAIGGQILPIWEEIPPLWYVETFEKRTWGENAHFLVPSKDTYSFSGANMAFQRVVLEKTQGFSLSFGIVKGKLLKGEDTEIFQRITRDYPSQSKIFWYNPALQVYHWTPRTNFSERFLFQNALHSGKSMAVRDRATPFSGKFFRMIGFMFKVTLQALTNALQTGNPVKTQRIMYQQKILMAWSYMKTTFLRDSHIQNQ